MRLEILRTAKPEAAGGSHYVVDNDAPGAGIYNPVFVGSLVDCAKYVTGREGGAPLNEPKCISARDLEIGNVILNVGRVLNYRTEKVFTYVDVETSRWSMTTGTPTTYIDNLIFHVADDIWVA